MHFDHIHHQLPLCNFPQELPVHYYFNFMLFKNNYYYYYCPFNPISAVHMCMDMKLSIVV